MSSIGSQLFTRVLGNDSVLHLLGRVGRESRTFSHLVHAGFPPDQLTEACRNFAHAADLPVDRAAVHRIGQGYFDDEELLQLFCQYYECDDWKLESSPLFFAKQDYQRFYQSLLSPIDFAARVLEQRRGEDEWGPLFLRHPFNLGMEIAKGTIWREVREKEHHWQRLETYVDLRAEMLFQYLMGTVNPIDDSKNLFYFNWERDFLEGFDASLNRFSEALERAVRHWQDVRNREKRRARLKRGKYPKPNDVPLIEVREALNHLGLDQSSATLEELRGSFRRLSKSAHPDQGGSDASFRYLSACREIAESWIRNRSPA